MSTMTTYSKRAPSYNAISPADREFFHLSVNFQLDDADQGEATMRAVVLFAVIAFLIPHAEAHGQSAAALAQSEAATLPTSHHGYKPKLSLQAALKIAEDFVAKEHIDVSGGWLYEARFTLYGEKTKSDREKPPCWFFQWIPESGLIGAQIEVVVFMDGKAMRLPTM